MEVSQSEEDLSDDLDEYIAERDRREPGFAALVGEKLRQLRAKQARPQAIEVGPPASDDHGETGEGLSSKRVSEPASPKP
jgi:hypothetical protein